MSGHQLSEHMVLEIEAGRPLAQCEPVLGCVCYGCILKTFRLEDDARYAAEALVRDLVHLDPRVRRSVASTSVESWLAQGLRLPPAAVLAELARRMEAGRPARPRRLRVSHGPTPFGDAICAAFETGISTRTVVNQFAEIAVSTGRIVELLDVLWQFDQETGRFHLVAWHTDEVAAGRKGLVVNWPHQKQEMRPGAGGAWDGELPVEAARSVPILDVAERLGLELRRIGKSWRGPCPIHGGKHPNFSIDPDRGIFKCFVCDVGGDAIELEQRVAGVGFADAVRRLAG